MTKKPPENKVVATNRKAHHNYNIIETYEAGMALAGYEVKSLRNGHVNLTDGYVSFRNNEAYIANIHISPYLNQSSHVSDYEPTRARKLLLHRQQINHLSSKTREKGLALIPLEVYFSKRGHAKLLLGLGKGKRVGDKRETLRKKSIQREIERELKNG